MRTLLEETEFYYDVFSKGKFDIILTEWRNLASFLGSYVEIVSPKEKIEGWATDIDRDGSLMIKLKDQTIHKATSGDMTTIKRINKMGKMRTKGSIDVRNS